MKHLRVWAVRFLGAYLLVLLATFLFALGSMKFNSLAIWERKLNPSTFVFWQGGEYYSNPPLFSQTMSDVQGQLTAREPRSFEDVDIWVLLLDGFAEIRNVEVALQLGIETDKIARRLPSQTTKLSGVSLSMRLHPVPFYVKRKSVLIMNAEFLRENYKFQCLDEMVYGAMIGLRDQALWDRCEVS
ncbi:hypothetical protein [Leisingera sp. M658]|uniref:hypothetical protein n=1 Tax=Leisingera sp. M658 TaxID=2867015 RepID=UPI0021A781D0|nr:hypothetical protein [Leisingera sp. M658]UWQ75037.1 hypothetical protein K3724_00755 [Leisingera sp. M658]